MRLVGLTGGIATGKSAFAAALREAGAPVIDADVLARDAVRKGSSALAEIARSFGPEVIGADGELDRKRMGALAFADAAVRSRLEAITHPAVRRAMEAARRRLAAEGHDLAFYDVPLLFEVGLDRQVDCVVVVWAPRALQISRLAARDGLSAAEAETRLSAQLPIDEKAARADVVVRNDRDLEALRRKAAPLLEALRAGLGRRLPNAAPARY